MNGLFINQHDLLVFLCFCFVFLVLPEYIVKEQHLFIFDVQLMYHVRYNIADILAKNIQYKDNTVWCEKLLKVLRQVSVEFFLFF